MDMRKMLQVITHDEEVKHSLVQHLEMPHYAAVRVENSKMN